MSRRLTFRVLPPQAFDDPQGSELYDTGPLLVFVVHGEVPPSTIEELAVNIGAAFPDRRAVVMVLREGQSFEVLEEESTS